MKIEKISDKMVYLDETITKRVLFNEDKVLNFILNLKPGQEVPPHNHENSDLIVHMLVGEGEVTVEGTMSKLTEGDVLHCDGAAMFALKNTGDKNMSCFVILTPNPSTIYSKEI